MSDDKDNEPVEPEKTEVVERGKDNEPAPPEKIEVTPFTDPKQ